MSNTDSDTLDTLLSLLEKVEAGESPDILIEYVKGLRDRYPDWTGRIGIFGPTRTAPPFSIDHLYGEQND